jgi:hypothetical protein
MVERSALVNVNPREDGQHERARLMIALSGPEGLSSAEQSWLALHLESCPPCRKFAQNSRDTIRSLCGIPITAGGRLVSKTQMRVRQRAEELQRQQERLWVICACCAAVTFSTAVTTTALWWGFAWMGQLARFSASVLAGGVVVFCLMPAVLAGILLLARGTFLTDHNGSYQH